MLWAQSTTKDYIRSENKLDSISELFIPPVYLQVSHLTSHHTTKWCFFLPIYIPRALKTGTCIQLGDLFYSAGLHRNWLLATANTGKNRERFWKKYRWMDRKGRNKQGRHIKERKQPDRSRLNLLEKSRHCRTKIILINLKKKKKKKQREVITLDRRHTHNKGHNNRDLNHVR